MTDQANTLSLSLDEIRAVTGYAVACARPVLVLFERHRPNDDRPRLAIDMAEQFAQGGPRTKAIRDAAWAAQKAAHAARDANDLPASEAARAALAAAGAAYLHPLAKATQVKHIFGSAAFAARATELASPTDPDAANDYLAQTKQLASPIVIDVLKRYPAAPSGGGRVGELVRQLDALLR